MIKFSELSEERIKDFAGGVIFNFNRGYDYYIDDMVEDFEYDPKKFVFCANIYGNYGCYDIEVWSNNDNIEANCNCPFDGYPCKHIVAVLLYFLNNKESFQEDLNAQKQVENRVKKKLSSLSKAELIRIILSYSQKYSSFKRELLLQLSIDKQKSIKQFFKEIDKIFRKFESDNFSTYEISRELKVIIKQIETADPDVRTEIIWKITDGILHELNEYGMNDVPLENLTIDTIDMLVHILNSNPDLLERRKEIGAELEAYCEWRNCGIIDHICDAVYELSENEI
jgi:hypothetical protein